MLLLYLDQNYLGRLTRPEHKGLRERLSTLAGQGRIVAPVSDVHLMELMKTPDHLRPAIVELAAELSRGLGLVNAVHGWRLEWERYRDDHDGRWMRSRILTRSFLQMIGPIPEQADPRLSIPEGLRLFSTMTSAPTVHEKTAAILEGATSRATRAVVAGELNEMRTGLAPVVGIQPEAVPELGNGFEAAFPSVAAHAAIQEAIVTSVEKGIEANDLPDAHFAGRVLPHFDLVTSDRRMGARIEEARARAGFKWARCVRRISDLNEAISEALRA